MSQNEILSDRVATYAALNRMIEAETTTRPAFRKLTERLSWLNMELLKTGWAPGCF